MLNNYQLFVLCCISERLKVPPGEHIDTLPHVLLRKYIAYARKYVPAPKLSADAAKVLQQFYLELRKQHQTCNSTPVTTRQLESLIRLTQVQKCSVHFLLDTHKIYFS